MTGEELNTMRISLGLSKRDFAVHVIGYTGSDRNVELRMRRLEDEGRIPLHLARFLYLVSEYYSRTGKLPHWPPSLTLEGEIAPWM